MHKKELETFLQAEGITYRCHDKTNDEICCSRNFFRLKVLPEIYRYFPFAKTGILRSLQVLSMDADYLEKQADKYWRKIEQELSLLQLKISIPLISYLYHEKIKKS